MADTFYVVKLVTGPWTNWDLKWVLQRQGAGAYEYRENEMDPSDQTEPLMFDSIRDAEAWVRRNRRGWWIELPPELRVGR